MSEHRNDPSEQRAKLREELAHTTDEADEEETVEEASLAPPGHLGERMNEGERRERGA